LWGISRFLSRLRDIKLLVAPQTISALTRWLLPCMLRTRTARTICAESGLSMPHRYGLNGSAQDSRMTIDFKAIRCGCMLFKVANKARFSKLSNPNSVSSSLSRRVRNQGRYTSFSATACRRTFGVYVVCGYSCSYCWLSVPVGLSCRIWYKGRFCGLN
jgi:hypothetical protein